MMLNYLETYQYTFSTRRHSLQPSASREKSARLLKNPARYCLCYRQSIELLPIQGVITIVKKRISAGQPSIHSRSRTRISTRHLLSPFIKLQAITVSGLVQHRIARRLHLPRLVSL